LRESRHACAVGPHDVDGIDGILARDEGDAPSIGREAREERGRLKQLFDLRAVRVHGVDMRFAFAVTLRGEDDAPAIRREGGGGVMPCAAGQQVRA
jgi:hypothetical protein